MSKKKSSAITLNAGLSLGNNSAEADDDYLSNCFFRTPAYEELTDFDSPKMIAAGRTGAGKTAILLRIKQDFGKISEIDPFDISLGFIANSDILNFLHAIGADLDLLFQVLWKHVLCVEYVRLRYSVKDESKWRSALTSIQAHFGADPRKKKALEYLKNFDGKFWVPFDENIKEIVEKITKELEVEFAADFQKFHTKAHYDKGVSSEKRAEIIARCRKIITPDQLRDLSQLIDLLGEDEKHQGKYFILIDKLDENWIDDKLRFRMIRALIETLRGFRRIRRLKIIVALRTDVLERVIQETRSLGFQKEKYEDYICDLRWTKPQLKTFISDRIQLLAQRKFDNKPIGLAELFPRHVANRDPFEYMCERTLNRPRDLLSFFNHCLKAAIGKQEVTASAIRDAERDYSLGRFNALIDEWKGAFPYLSALLNYASNVGPVCTLAELKAQDKIDDLILRVADVGDARPEQIFELANSALQDSSKRTAEELLRAAIDVLYRIGAVGVKPRNSDRFLYSHLDMPLLPPGMLSDDTRIRIHPMLVRALNVNSEGVDRAA